MVGLADERSRAETEVFNSRFILYLDVCQLGGARLQRRFEYLNTVNMRNTFCNRLIRESNAGVFEGSQLLVHECLKNILFHLASGRQEE